MIERCSITEENIINPLENENEDVEIAEARCLLSLTINELMGEDFCPYIVKNKNWGFDISIENDDENMIATSVHPYAAAALADFCRRYVSLYDKATSIE